jgi:hypothetical protein
MTTFPYGKEHEEEALKALLVLGLKKRDAAFPGFSDGGLTYLLSKFRSDYIAYSLIQSLACSIAKLYGFACFGIV